MLDSKPYLEFPWMWQLITGISCVGTLEALFVEFLLEILIPVEPETFKLDQLFQPPDIGHVLEPLRRWTAAQTSGEEWFLIPNFWEAAIPTLLLLNRVVPRVAYEDLVTLND